jgi:hypothetical protein
MLALLASDQKLVSVPITIDPFGQQPAHAKNEDQAERGNRMSVCPYANELIGLSMRGGQ